MKYHLRPGIASNLLLRPTVPYYQSADNREVSDADNLFTSVGLVQPFFHQRPTRQCEAELQPPEGAGQQTQTNTVELLQRTSNHEHSISVGL